MPVSPPHGPIYEENEFWYDLKEKALLYEVDVAEGSGRVQADHSRTRERGYFDRREDFYNPHRHYGQPHGIYLLDKVVGESRRKVSLSNIELLVRLWLQVEKNEQPRFAPYDEHQLLSVPKVLALFLAEKRSEMYKDESFGQGLTLLQIYLTAKAIPQYPSPTS